MLGDDVVRAGAALTAILGRTHVSAIKGAGITAESPVSTGSDNSRTSEIVRVPLREAAARLGIAPSALLKRIQRGKAQGLRDNHGHWLVEIDPTGQAAPPRTRRRGQGPDKAELQKLRAELDQAKAEIDQLVADRQELEGLIKAEKVARASDQEYSRRQIDKLSGSIASLSESLSGVRKNLDKSLYEADKARTEARDARAEVARLKARGLLDRIRNK